MSRAKTMLLSGIILLSCQDLHAEDYLANGTPDEAAGKALQELGGISLTKSRTWTSKSGVPIEATFIKFLSEDTIILSKGDGGFEVKIENLSEQDQELLNSAAVGTEVSMVTFDELIGEKEFRLSNSLTYFLMSSVFNDQQDQRNRLFKRLAEDQKQWEGWVYQFLARQTSDWEASLEEAISERLTFPNGLNEFEKRRHEQAAIQTMKDHAGTPPTTVARFFAPMKELGTYNFDEESFFFHLSTLRRGSVPLREREEAGLSEWPILNSSGRLTITHGGQKLSRSATEQINRNRLPFQLSADPEKAERFVNINDPLFILFEGKMDSMLLTGGEDRGIPRHETAVEVDAVSLWYWSEKKMAFVLLTKMDPKIFFRDHAMGSREGDVSVIKMN